MRNGGSMSLRELGGGESLAGLYTSIFPPHQIMRTHATRGIEGCVAGFENWKFYSRISLQPGLIAFTWTTRVEINPG